MIFIKVISIKGTNIDIYHTKLLSAKFQFFITLKLYITLIKRSCGKYVPWFSQQSTWTGKSEPIQFDIPQTKSPMQSSLVSQSPWLTLQGLALEQQDHTLSQSVN